MEKRLCRVEEGKMLTGVCGGLAEYFDVDPSLVRLAFVGCCVLGFSGLLVYIAATVIVPTKSKVV